MPAPGTPDRQAIVAMLATFRERSPEEVDEQIDSLELTWLVYQVEQRYGISLRESDEALAGISTVSDAVTVLRTVVDGHRT
jgi:acyl carrier protein